MVLEVIVTDLDDAINAAKGGADRLEIVGQPELEGLTPSTELVKKIIDKVNIPVRVMIRDKNSFDDFTLHELEKMYNEVRSFNRIGIDGVVIGFLKKDRSIDFEALQTALNSEKEICVTFHRAFDETIDLRKSLKQLIEKKAADRVLTSGGNNNAESGIDNLKNLVLTAENDIKIIAGGSITLNNIEKIRDKTGVSEFHIGRGARLNSSYKEPVDPDLVAKIVKLLKYNEK